MNTRRRADISADALRVGGQRQGGAHAGIDPSAKLPRAGGSGDPLMDRRAFLAIAATGLATAPFAAHGQRESTVPRIGYLTPGTGANEDLFWTELRRLGYVEGMNIAVEYRSAHGDLDKLPAFAAELVRLKVDIIVAVVTRASLAAKHATATIPIVIVAVS